jgi:hypothetical protein
VAASGSNVTVAVFFEKSIVVALTPGTRSSAFFTTMGQAPQVIFSTAIVTVRGGAAKAAPAPNNKVNNGKELRINRSMGISFS